MTTALEPRKSKGISFEDWMKLVNALLSHKLSLTAYDFPDWTWMDAYEDDFTPRQLYRRLLTKLVMTNGEG